MGDEDRRWRATTGDSGWQRRHTPWPMRSPRLPGNATTRSRSSGATFAPSAAVPAPSSTRSISSTAHPLPRLCRNLGSHGDHDLPYLDPLLRTLGPRRPSPFVSVRTTATVHSCGGQRWCLLRVACEKVTGIDLRITNFPVAAMEGGKATIVTNPEGTWTTLSVIAYPKSNDWLEGQIAKR
ncbi:hypothetical protein ABZP36_028126 [Zizania latifolia]